MKSYLPIILLLITLAGCKSKQAASSTASINTATTTAPIPSRPATFGRTAHAVIYRTKADYSAYVPVTLSDDGSSIVSYPGPGDVYFKGVIAKPTPLADGYLLDNRGVTPHSAFVRITYEEYSMLKDVPDLKDLYKMIIDKAPLPRCTTSASATATPTP